MLQWTYSYQQQYWNTWFHCSSHPCIHAHAHTHQRAQMLLMVCHKRNACACQNDSLQTTTCESPFQCKQMAKILQSIGPKWLFCRVLRHAGMWRWHLARMSCNPTEYDIKFTINTGVNVLSFYDTMCILLCIRLYHNNILSCGKITAEHRPRSQYLTYHRRWWDDIIFARRYFLSGTNDLPLILYGLNFAYEYVSETVVCSASVCVCAFFLTVFWMKQKHTVFTWFIYRLHI